MLEPWAYVALLVAGCLGCSGYGGTKTVCGNKTCESGERCETCPADCGQCNVCGDGKCSVTEVENCATCAKDCACPEILVCARELTLPPRCIVSTGPVCPDGPPRPFTFCLVAPNGSVSKCFDRFESVVTACTRDQAAAVAQAQAANYTLQDGPCPPCQ